MNSLKAKKSSKKGFTLMEMLIVVAIIAILVAIAIPTFNSSLSKAKKAADDANIRAAYAQFQVTQMTNADSTDPVGQASATDVVTAWTNIGGPNLQYYARITVPKTGNWTGTTEGTALKAAVTAEKVTINS